VSNGLTKTFIWWMVCRCHGSSTLVW